MIRHTEHLLDDFPLITEIVYMKIAYQPLVFNQILEKGLDRIVEDTANIQPFVPHANICNITVQIYFFQYSVFSRDEPQNLYRH